MQKSILRSSGLLNSKLSSSQLTGFDLLNLIVPSSRTIAAIERAGGNITCAYYDLHSVIALSQPIKFFSKGTPIPRR